MGDLNKIYIEPTNRCNLNCVTCIRNSWDEPFGDMDWSVYQTLIGGLADFPEVKTISFAGMGEPLLHPKLPEMIHLAHERGLRTEMTSNAMLLTPAIAGQLVDAGLDQFAVSIDGGSNEAYENIRQGSSLEQIIKNVAHLSRISRVKNVTGRVCAAAPTLIRIGVVFVAMQSNIQELPQIKKIAQNIGASFILVTNVLPYTAGLQDEILYRFRPVAKKPPGSALHPLWILPNMDFNEKTMKPLSEIFKGSSNLAFLDLPLSMRNNYCPFVAAGSVSVGWHGGISPCVPLMHSYSCFIRNKEKRFLRCEYGRLPNRSLKEIWTDAEYLSFRNRVRVFDFPTCTDCVGCELSEKNEEDCYNNKFPVCGDCLWAQGVLRCP
ncbi:MAG: radical SAM protein [Deltaproteobacteria bacterium HGW-Deltaproteobacteria-13]|jgi:MoaA/NifB/PqqE/SkfB family radical SAM enzyme|nr:MAG: radical SAM protein [Deltaproteobacteria bacterium HGW-Deltaproteobacteria-13]